MFVMQTGAIVQHAERKAPIYSKEVAVTPSNLNNLPHPKIFPSISSFWQSASAILAGSGCLVETHAACRKIWSLILWCGSLTSTRQSGQSKT
jgi:hypothetical protein